MQQHGNAHSDTVHAHNVLAALQSHGQSLAKMASPGPSTSEAAAAATSESFEKWVREKGGNNDLLELLKENGFTSKLSLENLDCQSPDAFLFVDLLNYGQKCLLQGLVKLLNKPHGTVLYYR